MTRSTTVQTEATSTTARTEPRGTNIIASTRSTTVHTEARSTTHCWLEQIRNCLQTWPNYMFFIPMTILEIAESPFFAVTVWTPGGAAIIFT